MTCIVALVKLLRMSSIPIYAIQSNPIQKLDGIFYIYGPIAAEFYGLFTPTHTHTRQLNITFFACNFRQFWLIHFALQLDYSLHLACDNVVVISFYCNWHSASNWNGTIRMDYVCMFTCRPQYYLPQHMLLIILYIFRSHFK